MCAKWTNSQNESGILRKSDRREKKEELFVFGYSCKLFRDDDKAQLIDQGKHLIPWMGDESLKIDRYDARGALHELRRLEAPPGGYDWRVELTKTEQEVEQLCDEERYRALHTDEDEEEMYREEELKRLHAAGYGQVGFDYDTPAATAEQVTPVEVDEPFVPTDAFKALLPEDVVLPDSEKQNVIIEKTAKFIASQGAQMEILIKAKQRDNPQFQFLNRDSVLYPYYIALTALVKAGKWPEKVEVVDDKVPENEEYLHPSLAPTIVEAAPSIPSIPYKPSADCDYTLLVCKMRGGSEAAEGSDIAPPGTEPLPPPVIARAPVRYTAGLPPPSPPPAPPPVPYYQRYLAHTAAQNAHIAQSAHLAHTPPPAPATAPLSSTGLSLMQNYDSDSGSDSDSSSSSKESIPIPPDDIAAVIDKMAAYVARNGDAFEDIVRAKNDPRFMFLEHNNEFHAYYRRLMMGKRAPNGSKAEKNNSAPVSFSIKKLKEPDPILPKPALPYESSSDDDSEKDKQTDKEEKEDINVNIQTVTPTLAPIIMYKMDSSANNIPPVKIIVKPSVQAVVNTVEPPKEVQKEVTKEETKEVAAKAEVPKEVKKSPTPEVKVEKEKERTKGKESPHVERKRHKDVQKDRRSEKRKKDRDTEREREKKRQKEKAPSKELEDEIISLVDNSDDMIDLTGDQSDTKTEETSSKQASRRRRAAEFLRRAGLDPAAADALPHTSLASAMVDTLETLRKKKAEEEEKRRKREKRRQRERHGHEDSHRKSRRRKHRSSDEEGSEAESARKRKRKHSKKSSKHKKRREQNVEEAEEEVDHELPPDMDLTSTLKELRTNSPTRELGLCVENTKDSPEEGKRIKKKTREDREYSEGEWSSDSDDDSASTPVED